MKKNIKNLLILIIVTLSIVFIYPTNIKAISEQLSFINIEDTNQSLKVGDLLFSNIAFKDYSAISTQAFGLAGEVINSSDKTINYDATVYYYDSDYNLIAEGNNSKTALEGTNSFNQMSNLSLLKEHSVSEIQYYSLFIDIKSESSGETNIESTTPSRMEKYRSYDYVIDKYDINIIVNENNTFDITETITAYFNTERHGIIRTIRLKNDIARLDGTTSTSRAQVTNLSIDNEYTISKGIENYQIHIGPKDHTITGEETYVIKYTYNIGKDTVSDYDELYYNIIGNTWDTVLGNVTFTIVMPKAFDSSKLGFSSEEKGSTNNSNIQYNVSGNKITGSYKGILDVGESLTVRCELEEGYFVGAGLSVNTGIYIVLLIPILFLGISVVLWYKYGRDEPVIETVEFYPPKGFNSLEVGFLYKGKADNHDVISLLIYLANKGYIKITEIEDQKPSSKSKEFKITKLKEYDGNNINEQCFLKGLFSTGKDPEENNLNEVNSSSLYDHFYHTTNKILGNINKKENRYKILEKTASNKTIFMILMIIGAYCFITVPPILTYGDVSTLIYAISSGFCFVVMFEFLFGEKPTIYVNGKTTKPVMMYVISGLIMGLLGVLSWVHFVLPILLLNSISLIGYIIGAVCILGMAICLKCLPKRTKYGNEILGKLRGFKNFLETAEKENLEAMVMKNPTYFYDILPYTYVLGVSDTWIKKFETISVQAPIWYDSTNAFDMIAFGTFMDSTMASAQSVMSSGSSSDSSGGGFSGGGYGGGGGGSW